MVKIFELRLAMENDAVQTAQDVADLMDTVKISLLEGKEASKIYDVNGNSIGSYIIREV